MRFPSFCRAYLAVVKSNGGQEFNLLLPSVVLTLNAIYKSILEAVQQVSACASLLMSALRDSTGTDMLLSHDSAHLDHVLSKRSMRAMARKGLPSDVY